MAKGRGERRVVVRYDDGRVVRRRVRAEQATGALCLRCGGTGELVGVAWIGEQPNVRRLRAHPECRDAKQAEVEAERLARSGRPAGEPATPGAETS